MAGDKGNTNIHIETKNLDGLEEIRYTTSILFDQVLKSGEVGFREWSKTDVLKYLQGL